MGIPAVSSIMVPLDGSAESVRAVALAARMAVFRRARLHLAEVLRPVSPVGNGMAAVPAREGAKHGAPQRRGTERRLEKEIAAW